MVYPDRKHVGYVNQIVNCLEELLPPLGFKISKLCDKTLPDRHFGENFERLAEDCILGIVILDGFRPNVLFEYGFLRGKNRVILPLQDRKACIAVKSFYPIHEHIDSPDIKANTGLTRLQFDKLKEPAIGYFTELSDRHGINVVCIDCDADLDSPEHPKKKIKSAITGLMTEVLAKYAKQSLRPIKQEPSEYVKKLQEVTLRILQYYTGTIPSTQKRLEIAFKDMKKLEEYSGVTMPSSIYSTLAASYRRLAQKVSPLAPTKMTKLLSKTIDLNAMALKVETKLSECASLHCKIGQAYWSIAEFRHPLINSSKAIKAYEEALTIYTKKDFPTEYGMTQNDLGVAYGELSKVKDTESNATKAIKAYEEALTISTKKDFPINYALVQSNLGTIYIIVSRVKDTESNATKAIKAYKEALTIRTKKHFPMKYMRSYKNLGGAYIELSKVKDTESNATKAIKICEEALTIYTKKDFRTEYAMTQNDLGEAYTILSRVKDTESNATKAIKAYEEALTISTKKDFPIYYAMTQNDLGELYISLSKTVETELNLEKAIKALEEALTINTKEESPMKYALSQSNIGAAYSDLSRVKDTESNATKAIKAYKEALTIYTKKSVPAKHAEVKTNLERVQQYLKISRKTCDN